MQLEELFSIFSKKDLHFAESRGILIRRFEKRYAPVAQLDRVTDYESVGRGFESLLAYQLEKVAKIPYFKGFGGFSFIILFHTCIFWLLFLRFFVV